MEDEQRLRNLEAQVAVLEKQVEFLMKIGGLDLSALRTAPDEDLLKYYQDSVQLLGIHPSKYPEEIIVRWSELLAQFSELEMTRLQGIIGYDHTWEPFYHLAVKMMTALRQRKGFANDATQQQIYAFLDRTRRHLRDVAIIMIKKYPETLPQRAKTLLRSEEISSYL